MKIFVVITAFLLLSKTILANNLDLSGFHERFEISTTDKGEKIIVDKTLTNGLGMDVYIKNIATYLKAEDADAVDAPATCQGVDYEKPNAELMASFKKAFDWMKKSNLGAMLENEKFLKFVNAIEIETRKYVKDPQFAVVANVDNPTYFYKKAFIKYMKRQLENIAKAYFNSTVFLKPVTYMADDYSNYIAAKKMYHQNILAYYLETFNPKDLGLTELEKNRALSSIVDSQLSFGFGGSWDSWKIKKNFDEYGIARLVNADAKAEKRWEKNAQLFDARTLKINSHFSDVVYKGEAMTINLGNRKSKTEDLASLAYDEKCASFLYESRRRFELVRVALGMSPVPYSNQLFSLVKSKYQPQAMSEGMLYGHYEATKQNSKLSVVMKQSMNPLLK